MIKTFSYPAASIKWLLIFGFAFFLPLAQAKLPEITASSDQSKTTLDVIQRLDNRHYLTQAFGDGLSSQFLDNYLARLDGNKSIFLQSDIDEFEQYRFNLDDALKKGELEAGFVIFNRYQQRLIARLELIVESLPDTVTKLDYSLDEEVLIDRSENPWPKTEAELDDIWRKAIKSRVLSLRLADKAEDEIAPLLLKRYKSQLYRVKQSNSEDAFQIYMNSLTELYDPHTSYFSPAKSENFNINMSLQLQGIGAVLQSEDEFTKVVRLVHAGPADKQGELQPSDKIISVAQGKDGEFEDVIGLRLDDVVQLIRGEKGTVVRLEIIPVSAKSNDEHTIIEIVRNTVKLEEQSAQKEMIETFQGDRLVKIGVIDVPTFYIDFEGMRKGDPNYRSTTRDVGRLLDELVKDGAEGIIIDLRENGGGSLQEANSLTGLFIDSGPTVQIRQSNSQVFRDGKRRSAPFYSGPLVVLINRLSASASEIFAGAIQDYQRGIIVGSQSFGKGTVQSLTPLHQGQLKITESKFYRISGESTQHRGVIPDVQFPTMYDKSKVGESSLDHALVWDRIAPIKHPMYYKLPAIVPELISKHEARVVDDPDFIFLQDQLVLLEEARAMKTIPLNEKARKAQFEQDKQQQLNIENKRRKVKGLDLLSSLDDEEDSEVEDASKESESSDEDDRKSIDENDPLLTEAANILVDAMPAFVRERYATRKLQ